MQNNELIAIIYNERGLQGAFIAYTIGTHTDRAIRLAMPNIQQMHERQHFSIEAKLYILQFV